MAGIKIAETNEEEDFSEFPYIIVMTIFITIIGFFVVLITRNLVIGIMVTLAMIIGLFLYNNSIHNKMIDDKLNDLENRISKLEGS